MNKYKISYLKIKYISLDALIQQWKGKQSKESKLEENMPEVVKYFYLNPETFLFESSRPLTKEFFLLIKCYCEYEDDLYKLSSIPELSKENLKEMFGEKVKELEMVFFENNKFHLVSGSRNFALFFLLDNLHKSGNVFSFLLDAFSSQHVCASMIYSAMTGENTDFVKRWVEIKENIEKTATIAPKFFADFKKAAKEKVMYHLNFIEGLDKISKM